MSARLLPWQDDPTRPSQSDAVAFTLDGVAVVGVLGQSIGGVILAAGTSGFRRTSNAGAPRGVFCGIGVCFDCLVEVNGLRDVRACQRKARDSDVVITQFDALPVTAPTCRDDSTSASSANAESAHPEPDHPISDSDDAVQS